MNGDFIKRAEFDQRVQRTNLFFGATALIFVVILLLFAVVLSSLSTRAKTNRVADLEQATAAAVTLCRKQNRITDTLVQAAIKVVSVPPNPPEDRIFIAVFSAQHEVLTDPKTCQALKVS